MADTFTFTAASITLTQGYKLAEKGLNRNNEVIHIDFSDVTFIRKKGEQSSPISANGLETFPTLAAAKTFIQSLALMQDASSVVIKHDRLTDGDGVAAECLSSDTDGIMTNITPGFHIIWRAEFRVFP